MSRYIFRENSFLGHKIQSLDRLRVIGQPFSLPNKVPPTFIKEAATRVTHPMFPTEPLVRTVP